MGVSKFSSEVRERSVQLVLEQGAQHKSQWQAVTSVAQKLGCHAATVLSWVRQYERDGGRREGVGLEGILLHERGFCPGRFEAGPPCPQVQA